MPAAERAEVEEVFQAYGLAPEEIAPVVEGLARRPEAWVDFMMRYELGLEKPEPRRAPLSALTIAGSYVAGGLIPLGPYMVLARVGVAVICSVAVTLAALSAFGYVKGRFTGARPARSAAQTTLIGGLAAAAAFLIAKAIS